MHTLAVLLLAGPLLAQPVSFGIGAGIPVTPMIIADPPRRADTSRFTAGPLLEVRLSRGAALSADFLVQHAGLSLPAAGPRSAGAWRWDVPATVLYRFRAGPFVRAGVAVNRVFAVNGADECGHGPFGETFYCLGGQPLAELRHRSTIGFVAGAGWRFGLGRIHIDPEVRWTRWRDRNFGVRDAAVRSNLSEVSLLAGIVF